MDTSRSNSLPMRTLDRGYRPWTLADIPYDAIDRERARSDPYLLYLTAGASFVEITADLYAQNLVTYFSGDSRVQRWLAERWESEEKQHGRALKQYVATVWPEFDWERAYRGFFDEYSPYCEVSQLGPTRALELASRCVVETGTATFYAALSQASPEPVLSRLAARISKDEQRHYNMFSYHYRHWVEIEGTGRGAVLGALYSRLGELDREDIYIAVKHVFQTLHPDRPFTTREYRRIRSHYTRLARRHYSYRTAAGMLVTPLRLSPIVTLAAVPLVAAAGWLLAA